jgi:hypothetical protein
MDSHFHGMSSPILFGRITSRRLGICMMVRALREFWAAFCVACGCGEACSFARVRGVTTSEFLSWPAKSRGLVFLQQQQPVIDLAELVSTKAGTISGAYSLTPPPHVRLPLVQSQVIYSSFTRQAHTSRAAFLP